MAPWRRPAGGRARNDRRGRRGGAPGASRGTAVNVASRASFHGDDHDRVNRAASKAAMVSLTRSIARRCAGDSMLAYAVAPGHAATDMVAGIRARQGPAALAPHATGTTIDIGGASYAR